MIHFYVQFNFGFTSCEGDYCCVSNLLEVLKTPASISVF